MMAMMFVASATAFAGDSDALKGILKSKNYAEAAQMLQQNLGQLADNAEKAKAYNHLVDLAMAKVQNETGIMAENQMAAMGQGKVKAYDTLGLADNICNAIQAALECDKFDQLPDAKGKVKPKFDEKNAQRIWAVRTHLVNIGQEQAAKGSEAGVLKYWGAFVDSAAFLQSPESRSRAGVYRTGCLLCRTLCLPGWRDGSCQQVFRGCQA